MPLTVRELILDSTRLLADSGVENARLDVEVLLMHLLSADRAHLYLAMNDAAPGELATALRNLVERRAAGEPVAYLTGHREFMELEFSVDPRVLIPRPETEGLVERAVCWVQQHPDARCVVDTGTGSGAIAISIDHFTPSSRPMLIIAGDVSRQALDVARVNRKCLSAMRVEFVNGDLLDWCAGPIDLIVANLPYLKEEQRNSEIAPEPDLALYAGGAGFGLYAALIPQAARILSRPGALMCEIDPGQASVAARVASSAFADASIRIEQDLAGRDRYLIVERPD